VTEAPGSSRILRFGVFEYDPASGELRKQGMKIKLQGQPIEILRLLIEHQGKVVSREELQQKLWLSDTFVDFEHSLNAAIKRLRDALGDSAENPRFVETVARRGYRFIAVPEIPAVPSTRPAPRLWVSATRKAVVVGLVLCALVLSLTLYYHSIRPKAVQTVTPVVTTVGKEQTPALSPDGQHLAFVWNGGTGTHFSLYVKVVGTEESLRLTNKASLDFDPVWSPDGRYIAFCRILKGATGIYIIPALGGAERKVRNTGWDGDINQDYWILGHLSWSPDGKLLAYSDHASHSEGSNSSIFLLSLDSLEVRTLTSPLHSKGDFDPQFSPDGQTLAFVRVSQDTSIYTIPVAGGQEQRLSSDQTWKEDLAWTPDGREIVFSGSNGLWKISHRGGEPERLPFGEDGIQPSIRGNRLVYVKPTEILGIWRRTLNSLVSAGPPDRFITSTRMDAGPQFSPDGSKIVFGSTRTGNWEFWLCNSDGSSLMQLTHSNPTDAGTPRWSPDGQQIAFDSNANADGNIFVMDSQGGSPRRLTSELSSQVVPSWSRDGRWIYFASDRTGRWEVWKMPSTGGLAVQVTRHGGFAAFESPDGKTLYYAKGLTVPGLWRIPTNGGEEVEVISTLEAGYWGYWAVIENGIYYLDTTTKPGIVFFDFTTQRSTRVFDVDRPLTRLSELAVSPDKRTILYTAMDARHFEIILVENFR